MSIKCPLCGSINTRIKYEVTLNDVTSKIDNRSDEVRKEIKRILGGGEL